MTKRKTDPVVLQMASDLAQIEARIESVTQSAVAHNGAVERRLREVEGAVMRIAADQSADGQPAPGDVYNITVNEGGVLNIDRRA